MHMIQRVADLGIVGAGGAGYPLAQKLTAKAEVYIVNAAECEPLLHKDEELMRHHADVVLSGLLEAMAQVQAKFGIVGIKQKHEKLIAALEPQLPANVRIAALKDAYPAGDEFLLVYETIGKVIPPGGLPLDVGAIVSNVETLANVGFDRPVTHKFLTVAGDVHEPTTLRVAIGTSLRTVIDQAGGACADEFGVLLNGAMMGRIPDSLDQPVTKRTAGLIVLPAKHPLIIRYSRPPRAQARIGRSACDQCTFCTELCPRYLLGHPIEPHKAMRALGFTPNEDDFSGSLYCCECNLCSLYSCPEDLDPGNTCVSQKPRARMRELGWRGNPDEIGAHPLREYRQVPTKRLMRRLGLAHFADHGPLRAGTISPDRVRIPLLQHQGVPAQALVREGEAVQEGQLLAAPPPDALGANIHASISGQVHLEADHILIQR